MAGSDIGFEIEVIDRPKGSKGFVNLAKCWVVERTFEWFDQNRRISKDYKQLVESAEARIWLCSIDRMWRRLEPPPGQVPYKYRAGVDQKIASNIAA